MTATPTRRTYPIPGFPGLSARFTYYRVASDAHPGDGARVEVIRDEDNAVMSVEHPDAAELRDFLTTSGWVRRMHVFLEDIRRAGLGAHAPDESARAHLN